MNNAANPPQGGPPRPTKKYQKRITEVDAIQWTSENTDEIINFLGQMFEKFEQTIAFQSSKGLARIRPGDYIVTDEQDRIYPSTAEFFESEHDVGTDPDPVVDPDLQPDITPPQNP